MEEKLKQINQADIKKQTQEFETKMKDLKNEEVVI